MKIVIAIEDNNFADAILEMLNQLMWTEFSVIRIVHVMTPMDKTMTWPGEFCRNEANELVAGFAKRIKSKFQGVTTDEVVLEGYAAEEIIDCAVDWQADLIILGSHGKRGLSRFLIGKTASSVSTHAPCSVLIVRPEHLKIKRISKNDLVPSTP